MRRVVYLSGRIANCTYEEATAARNEAKKLLAISGWDSLDPMRGKEILSSMKSIDEKEASKMLGVTPAAIIQRDFDDLRRADAILVLSGDEPSWGTGFEWAIANFEMRKPIVVICSEDSPTRDHPWCMQMAAAFVPTVPAAIEFLNKWFDRGYLLDSGLPMPPGIDITSAKPGEIRRGFHNR